MERSGEKKNERGNDKGKVSHVGSVAGFGERIKRELKTEQSSQFHQPVLRSIQLVRKLAGSFGAPASENGAVGERKAPSPYPSPPAYRGRGYSRGTCAVRFHRESAARK